jgi:hypothetical protein
MGLFLDIFAGLLAVTAAFVWLSAREAPEPLSQGSAED